MTHKEYDALNPTTTFALEAAGARSSPECYFSVMTRGLAVATLESSRNQNREGEEWNKLSLKALEKDPRQRFAHVLEFASALKQASLR